MSEQSEFVQLLRAARCGCRKAGEELVRAYGQHIICVAKRYARRYGTNGELDADDLAQSAWRILLTEPSALARLDPPQILRYVRQIIAHKAIDASRRGSVRSHRCASS